MFLYLDLVCVCVCVLRVYAIEHVQRSEERKTFWSWASPLAMWVPGIELGLSVSVTSTFTH